MITWLDFYVLFSSLQHLRLHGVRRESRHDCTTPLFDFTLCVTADSTPQKYLCSCLTTHKWAFYDLMSPHVLETDFHLALRSTISCGNTLYSQNASPYGCSSAKIAWRLASLLISCQLLLAFSRCIHFDDEFNRRATPASPTLTRLARLTRTPNRSLWTLSPSHVGRTAPGTHKAGAKYPDRHSTLRFDAAVLGQWCSATPCINQSRSLGNSSNCT